MNPGMPSIVLVTIALPATASILTLLMARWPSGRRWMGWMVALGQVGLALVALAAFDTPPSMGATAGPVTIAQMSTTIAWMSAIEPPARLAVDGLNLYALLLLSVVTLLALVTNSLDGLNRSALRQAGILAVSATAAGYLLSRDLLLAAACHGFTALALGWVLHLGADPRPRKPAALSFLIPGLIASGLLWVAATWSRAAGDGLSASVDGLVALTTPTGAVVALTLFLILHLPLLPLHRWQTVGCGEGAAYSGIILVGGLWMMFGVTGWLRLGLPLCAVFLEEIGPLLQIWGALSALVATGIAALQSDLGDRLRWACVALAGFVAVGLGSMNLAAVTGALLLCAAIGLPRAAALSFVRWLPEDAGGPRLTLWWVLLAVSLAAVTGTGGFAGLMSLLSGSNSWPGWLSVLTATALVGVLMMPTAGLWRGRVAPIPGPLSFCLIVAVSIALLSGWRPVPLTQWAIPDVERILASSPSSSETGEDAEELPPSEDDEPEGSP